MNIDDILDTKARDDRPNFNVEDDLQCYMKDNTMFYRKQYYPTMCKCQECYNNGDSDKVYKFVMPMISKAIESYISEYDLPYTPNELCTPDEQKMLAQKIYDDEVEGFKEGEY